MSGVQIPTPTTTPRATPDKHLTASSAGPAREPIQEILNRLQQSRQIIADYSKPLADKIDDLLKQAGDPLRLNQRSFHHEVAYTFQDIEKKSSAITISTEARTQLDRLTGSAPGLESERMLALMRATTGINDDAVVRDIRRAGAEIGRQANQDTPEIREQIDVLENRARLGQRAPAATTNVSSGSNPQTGTSSNREGDTDPSTNAPPNRPSQQRQSNPEQRTATIHQDWSSAQAHAQQQQQQPTSVVRESALGSILRAMRSDNTSHGVPWDPLPTPMGPRLTAYEAQMGARRNDIVLRDAEKAGHAALDALEGFRTGEGATVMNRIQAAARTEPGGISTVLSEMREGGRFADLRRQFNTALSDDKGFASAYDQAASALAQYGQGRPGIEQVIARRPDAANLAAKFERLDAEIAEAADSTPSRRDGKNMLDDIAKTAAEIARKAVEAIKSLFSRSAAGPSGGPGPSPGP